MKLNEENKVLCETPTPGKKPTRIDQWKYDCVRSAIRKSLPEQGNGLLFKELPDRVKMNLSEENLSELGSVTWYTTTVKLDMEVKGEIYRVPRSNPQRLLKKS